MTPTNLNFAEDEDADAKAIGSLLRGEVPFYEVEKRYVRKDGKVLWVHVNATLLRDAAGRPERTMAVVEDISARKQAENALRIAEENLRDFVDNATLGLHWVGADGIILWANRAELELLGYTAEEYIGRHIAEFHADQPVIEDILQRLTRRETLREFEARLRCKDGSIREVLISSNVLWDGDKFVHTRCFTRDVTERKRAEETRAMLATIVESSEDAILSKNLNGTIATWNRGAERLFGYSAQEAIGQPVTMLFPPDKLDEEMHILAEVRGGKRVLPYETLRLRKDGTMLNVSLSVSPIVDARGQIVGASKIARDITARKQAEDALRESQQFTRRVLDNLFAFVGVMTPDGTLIEANRAPLEAAGIAASEVLGKKFWDTYWWSYSPEMQAQLRDWCNQVAGGEIVRSDVQVRMAGETRVWIDFQLTPLRDADGRITHLIPSGMDISARREAEAALRASEERFRAAVGAVSDIVWTNNAQGKMEAEQPTWGAFTGQRQEDYQGYGWSKAVHPEDAQPTIDAWNLAVAETRTFEFEHRVRRHDGAWRLCSIKAVPVLDPTGEIREWVGVHTDITDRKRAEEQLRQLAAALSKADQRKDEFLATLAHELRNPMAPLRNGLQLMKLAGGQTAAVDKTRAMMERQLAQMVRLVDDLMDVSRISSGKLQLRKERVPLSAVVNSAVEASRPLIEQMGHELTVTLPQQPLMVDADLTRLAQVFLNLLNNAAKYSHRGGHIRLSAESQGADVVVTVTDNGIGISADQLPRIFEMFTQVDRSLAMSQGGLGIGLTLVKRLVELHGGRVEANSEGPGNGSEFVLRLPVVGDTSKPQESGGAVGASFGLTLRILVVDDNRDGADSLSEMLTRMGNETRTAYDGEEGVNVAGEFRPDVIVLDIGLPKLNGYEACRRIREQSGGKNVVMIAASGWGQPEDRRRAFAAGFDHHLVKPVDPQDLMKLLAGVDGLGASMDAGAGT